MGLILADAVSAMVLFGLVLTLRFDFLDPNAEWRAAAGTLQVAAAYATIWVGALWILGLYRLRAYWSLRGEFIDLARAAAIAAVTSFSLIYLFKLEDVSRLFVIVLVVSQPIATVTGRLALRTFLGALRSRAYNSRQVLIVGAGNEAREFARELERHSELGLRIMGHLVAPGEHPAPPEYPVIGTFDQIEDVLHNHVVDEVVICLPPRDWSYVEPLTRICAEEGKIVRVSMRALGGALTGGRSEQLGDIPLVTFLHGPDRVVGLAIKRVFDIAISGLSLVLLSPVILGVTAYIRLRDGAPVLFAQERVGLHGRPFKCYKFRTMVPDAEARFPQIAHLSEVRGPAFKLTNDPRITRTGAWLRRTSIDELPQLINVLRGEMSIVGPRPAVSWEVAKYSVWHRRRLSMRPGMTGLWQVEARRDNDFDTRAQHDLQYIDRWSVWLDIKILLRTIPAVWQQQGR
jgi:exopolysaccharide biosynthesis polyprenyl glycosylphosphotransferase